MQSPPVMRTSRAEDKGNRLMKRLMTRLMVAMAGPKEERHAPTAKGLQQKAGILQKEGRELVSLKVLLRGGGHLVCRAP